MALNSTSRRSNKKKFPQTLIFFSSFLSSVSLSRFFLFSLLSLFPAVSLSLSPSLLRRGPTPSRATKPRRPATISASLFSSSLVNHRQDLSLVFFFFPLAFPGARPPPPPDLSLLRCASPHHRTSSISLSHLQRAPPSPDISLLRVRSSPHPFLSLRVQPTATTQPRSRSFVFLISLPFVLFPTSVTATTISTKPYLRHRPSIPLSLHPSPATTAARHLLSSLQSSPPLRHRPNQHHCESLPSSLAISSLYLPTSNPTEHPRPSFTAGAKRPFQLV